MKVILPLFLFPPYSKVGAQRWYNLALYLSNFYYIEVWTVNRKGINKVSLNNINLKIKNSDPIYKFMEKEYKNKYFQSIFKKLISVSTKLLGYNDYCEYWTFFINDQIIAEAKHGSLFILTGGPFSVQSKLFHLLNKISYKNFIMDFQDPWTTDYYQKFSIKYQNLEIKMLKDTFSKKVFVTEGLANNMQCEPLNKTVIENGHDFNLEKIKFQKKIYNPLKKLKVLYLGSLSNGRDDLFIQFLKKIENSKIFIRFDIYGRISIKLRLFINEYLRKNRFLEILTYDQVPRVDIYQLSNNYHLGLQINADCYPFLVSTKVYEYPALCLPQISICKNGDIINMIKKNNIGIVVNPIEESQIILDKIQFLASNYNIDALYQFAIDSTWIKRAKQYKELIDRNNI